MLRLPILVNVPVCKNLVLHIGELGLRPGCVNALAFRGYVFLVELTMSPREAVKGLLPEIYFDEVEAKLTEFDYKFGDLPYNEQFLTRFSSLPVPTGHRHDINDLMCRHFAHILSTTTLADFSVLAVALANTHFGIIATDEVHDLLKPFGLRHHTPIENIFLQGLDLVVIDALISPWNVLMVGAETGELLTRHRCRTVLDVFRLACTKGFPMPEDLAKGLKDYELDVHQPLDFRHLEQLLEPMEIVWKK